MEITIHKSWLPYTVKVHGDKGEILFEQVVDFPKEKDPILPPDPESLKKNKPIDAVPSSPSHEPGP
jgi:hypothetical protein